MKASLRLLLALNFHVANLHALSIWEVGSKGAANSNSKNMVRRQGKLQALEVGAEGETEEVARGTKCVMEADIILAIDGSGSVRQAGWDASVKAANALTDALVDSHTAMAILIFSGSGSRRQDFMHHGLTHDKTQLDMTNVQFPRGRTPTAEGLNESNKELTEHGRKDSQKFIIVITDGKPNSVSKTNTSVEVIKKQGIHLIFVPVGNGAPLEQIKAWASSPDDIIKVEDYTQLGTHVVTKVSEVACKTAEEAKKKQEEEKANHTKITPISSSIR